VGFGKIGIANRIKQSKRNRFTWFSLRPMFRGSNEEKVSLYKSGKIIKWLKILMELKPQIHPKISHFL
jgi:hypothetical protein